jgi:exopolyphosphatase/guanosine-5'-triphosphate,3'-diphosphate pyrophosphatase
MHIEQNGRRRRRHGLELSQAEIIELRARLERSPLARRRRIPGLRAERADIIVAGAVVIEELMLFGGYPSLTVCTAGVRDGILLGEAFT